MLESIKRFKLVRASFWVSGAFVLGGWLWAYVALRGIEQPLIIHFVSRQINQIGGVGDLAAIGIFGVLVVLVNFFVSEELEKRDLFLGKLLAAATLFVCVLIFIAFATIIHVN